MVSLRSMRAQICQYLTFAKMTKTCYALFWPVQKDSRYICFIELEINEQIILKLYASNEIQIN